MFVRSGIFRVQLERVLVAGDGGWDIAHEPFVDRSSHRFRACLRPDIRRERGGLGQVVNRGRGRGAQGRGLAFPGELRAGQRQMVYRLEVPVSRVGGRINDESSHGNLNGRTVVRFRGRFDVVENRPVFGGVLDWTLAVGTGLSCILRSIGAAFGITVAWRGLPEARRDEGRGRHQQAKVETNHGTQGLFHGVGRCTVSWLPFAVSMLMAWWFKGRIRASMSSGMPSWSLSPV